MHQLRPSHPRFVIFSQVSNLLLREIQRKILAFNGPVDFQIVCHHHSFYPVKVSKACTLYTILAADSPVELFVIHTSLYRASSLSVMKLYFSRLTNFDHSSAASFDGPKSWAVFHSSSSGEIFLASDSVFISCLYNKAILLEDRVYSLHSPNH